MSFYESVFILRQDLTTDNVQSLCKKFSKVLEDNGGKIAKTEYWGLRSLAFKINKNKKGHYLLINSESSAPAILKMKQLLKMDENILRDLTIRISKIEKEPSIIMEGDKNDRRERGNRTERRAVVTAEKKKQSSEKDKKEKTTKDHENKDTTIN